MDTGSERVKLSCVEGITLFLSFSSSAFTCVSCSVDQGRSGWLRFVLLHLSGLNWFVGCFCFDWDRVSGCKNDTISLISVALLTFKLWQHQNSPSWGVGSNKHRKIQAPVSSLTSSSLLKVGFSFHDRLPPTGRLLCHFSVPTCGANASREKARDGILSFSSPSRLAPSGLTLKLRWFMRREKDKAMPSWQTAAVPFFIFHIVRM